MVEKFRLTNAKNVSTPMDPNTQYSLKQCPSTINQVAKMRGGPYSKALGSVLWPTVVSCPDTAYAVGILSQFMQNPGQAHWKGIKKSNQLFRTYKRSVAYIWWQEARDVGIAMQTGQVKYTVT